LGTAELEAGFVAQNRLLDDHGVAFLARFVWPFGDRVADAWVADDIGVSESVDNPNLSDAGSAIRRWTWCRRNGGFGFERFQACSCFLGRQPARGNLAQDFAL
jgi:hypothetical protein